ncbi:carbon-nitrogen hydrolase [Choiromyces venosus 120613-1]|uniref:Carbon-nitrogen hydrolase n=1 Tax=Choiromyces venosus 120613-1 TaxID=1336337 RepID=A0A3N4JHH0_9PEZI|nr:carbon-nitrogen hydrolase [Choiromyces venosus 120613-1]
MSEIPTKWKCAVIQLHPKRMQLEDNFNRSRDFIRKAAEAGAQLAVLPEYFLTSWAPEDPGFADAHADRVYLSRFCELAKECDINIVPGTFVEKHVEDGKDMLYNVAYFISNDGEILGSYTKKNLWHTEKAHLETSGNNPHTVIDTPLGKVGLLICWDLAFPEAFRALIIQGAKIIIIPSFWTLLDLTESAFQRNPRSEAIYLESIVVSRAFENTSCIAFANVGGRGESGFAGLSKITMPLMGDIAKAEGTHEQMIIGEVDMEILQDAEDSYKVREDISRPGFHYPVYAKI